MGRLGGVWECEVGMSFEIVKVIEMLRRFVGILCGAILTQVTQLVDDPRASTRAPEDSK